MKKVNQKLVDYVKNMVVEGHSIKDITHHLLLHGHSRHEIDKAMLQACYDYDKGSIIPEIRSYKAILIALSIILIFAVIFFIVRNI